MRALVLTLVVACAACACPRPDVDVNAAGVSSSRRARTESGPSTPSTSRAHALEHRTATCIIDPSDDIAKECHHVTAGGGCAHFGAPCAGIVNPPRGAAPAGAASGTCMVDPATNSRRTCHHVTAGGGCAHFGGPC